MNKFATGSLGAVTTHRITEVGTLGPVGGNPKVTASVATSADY